MSSNNINNNENQFDLVKGVFSTEEAWEIISNLISNKINFHERQSFSQQIRFGKEDENTLKRIAQLQKSKEAIKQLVEEAKKSGKSLNVNAEIHIELL